MPDEISTADNTSTETPVTETTTATTETPATTTSTTAPVTPAAPVIDLSEQNPETNGSAWLQGLPEEFRTDGTFTKYTSQQEMLKGMKEMATKLRTRQESVTKPDENSTDEQRAAWREHLGTPKEFVSPDSISELYIYDLVILLELIYFTNRSK